MMTSDKSRGHGKDHMVGNGDVGEGGTNLDRISRKASLRRRYFELGLKYESPNKSLRECYKQRRKQI